MSSEQEIVLSGPDLIIPIYEGSLAQRIIPKMRNIGQDHVIQVDGATGETMTTYELLKLSLEVTEGLKARGFQQGDVIIFLGRNGTELFAGALGTIWLGCTAAPVDPAMKVLELKHLFNVFKPKMVFCEKIIGEDVLKALQLLQNEAPVVLLNEKENSDTRFLKFSDILRDVDVENYEPLPVKDPVNNLAIIACSSGSTGLPKGVSITHRNILFHLTSWDAMPMPIALNAVFLQLTQFFWISGIVSLLASCSLGIKRVFVRNFDEDLVLGAIEKYKAQMVTLSPAELSSLLKYPGIKKYNISSMKHIITGGAPLPLSLRDKVKQDLGSDVICSQGYGMTEMTGGVTYPPPEDHVASIGKLAPGIQAKVIDLTTKKSLGPNQNGEFCYKSPGLMKSYYNNEEDTNNAIDKDGWLHSGDLGYYNEEGYLYIVDRIKEFIKFRTWQVPPVEVESLISSLPGVKDVGVAGVPNDEDIYHPMALVVKEKGASITEEEIIRFIEENLSDHKRLRAGVKFVDSIPRTPVGKIKRTELKELAKRLHSSSK